MRGRAAGRVVGPLLASLVGMFVAAACSNNGEGERCDFDNGNDDCQDGLVCVPATAQGNRGAGYGTVNALYNSSDRCCPLPRSLGTHPACAVGGALTGDAGPTQPSDASSDASDASSDASNDAPDAD